MNIGSVARLKKWEHHFISDDRRGRAGFSAPTGRVVVMAILGDEPADGSAPLDIDGAMLVLGWQRKQSAWQPIDTAPKDGTTVILYDPSYIDPVVVGAWDTETEDEGGRCWREQECDDRVIPTHWQPLPDAPEQDTKEGK